MLISVKERYIGEVYVIPVIGKKQERKWAESQHYKDQTIKNGKNANYVDSSLKKENN